LEKWITFGKMGHSWKEREKVGNKAQTWIKRVTLGKIGET